MRIPIIAATLAIVLISFPISATKADTNFSVIPSDYYIGLEGQMIVTDPLLEHTSGYPSIRLDSTTAEGNNPNRECYSRRVAIKVGYEIVFSCYIKISETGMLCDWGGARLGIDFYDDGGRITALQSDGQHGYYPNEDAQAILDFYVEWGKDGWTKRTIDFIVPAQMESDGSFYEEGTLKTPTSIVPWIQVWDSNGCINMGQAWFADSELAINPTGEPSATLKPTLSTIDSYSTTIYLMALGLGIVVLFATRRVVNKALESPQMQLLLLELKRRKQKIKTAIKEELESIFSYRLFK